MMVERLGKAITHSSGAAAVDEWVTAGEVGYITLTEEGKETTPFLTTSWR